MVNNLGLVLRDMGDFQEARKCFERAIKIDEQVYGLAHPKVARDVSNLGSVLQDLGDLQGPENATKELSRSTSRSTGRIIPLRP